MLDGNTPAADLALIGRLEIKDVERVQAQLLEALAVPRPGTALCIDLSGIEAIDTAGAQLLLAAARDAQQSGLRLQYRNASVDAQRVLTLLGLREAVLGSGDA